MFRMALYIWTRTARWTGRQDWRSCVAGVHVNHERALYCSNTNLNAEMLYLVYITNRFQFALFYISADKSIHCSNRCFGFTWAHQRWSLSPAGAASSLFSPTPVHLTGRWRCGGGERPETRTQGASQEQSLVRRSSCVAPFILNHIIRSIPTQNHWSVSLFQFSFLALSVSLTPSQQHMCSGRTFRKSGHWLSACGQEAQNQWGSPFAGAVET